ncbi:MAG: OmpH family outer membrane protein [Putridiphycobacter sp.]|nr:OmpH family outer membrane protein [Putridiphycobacter sp.]
MKKIFLALVITFSISSIMAQTNLKFGHVDYAKVTDSIPTKLAADKEMKQFIEDGQRTIRELQTILQRDYEEYMAKRDSMSALMREIKEKNFMEQQQVLENKQQTLQNDLEIYDNRLYKPIENNFKKAVKTVSLKYKLNYVFEVGSLLYLEGGIDITEEVKQELIRLEALRTAPK